MSNNIICFLTVKPSEQFYNFVKELPNPENIYICIDYKKYIIPNYNNEIKIIKVDSNLCIENGYYGTVKKYAHTAVSRDKALYYFCKNDIDFDNIWFIEEDVFVPTINTIKNIDKKYPNFDLLSASHHITNRKRNDWQWKFINQQIKLKPPYASSMICAIRCSKKLLECIKNYVERYNSLFMDEALFNTLALQNRLNVNTIPELSTIHYRKKWGYKSINKTNLYHPIKNTRKQSKIRNKLKY